MTGIETLSKKSSNVGSVRRIARLRADSIATWTGGQHRSLAATFATTVAVFGIFLVQGIIVARLLGPAGRGEFGTALYFPRDLLLYVGLLGAVEIIAGYSARRQCDAQALRQSALRMGLVTGALTAVAAFLMAVCFLLLVGKAYLIPYCLLLCLFVPWEHIQLTVSAVDRGRGLYTRYNVNRLVFAATFPVLVMVGWSVNLHGMLGISTLLMVCALFVVGRLLGMLPTLRGIPLRGWLRGSEATAVNAPGAGKLLKEGRPYGVSMFVSELFDRLDIFLILAIADVATAGLYFVAIPAAALLIIAPNSLSVFTFNAGARPDVRVTVGQATAAIAALLAVQVVATVGLALLIKPLIILFYGSQFAGAVPFALWLLPASAIKGFLQAADGYLKGRRKPWIGVWSRAASMVAMLVFVALAYPSQGVISIPMAACLGQALSMITIVAALYADLVSRNRQQINTQIKTTR